MRDIDLEQRIVAVLSDALGTDRDYEPEVQQLLVLIERQNLPGDPVGRNHAVKPCHVPVGMGDYCGRVLQCPRHGTKSVLEGWLHDQAEWENERL